MLNKLSKAEMQVYVHVVAAKSNKDVAQLLQVTERTIKFHMTNILAKMNVKSRSQLILQHVTLKGAA